MASVTPVSRTGALVDQSSANQPDASAAAWEQSSTPTPTTLTGNRLSAPGITSTPVYDAQDRMLAYGACTYAYKSDGSLQTKSCPDGTTSGTYSQTPRRLWTNRMMRTTNASTSTM